MDPGQLAAVKDVLSRVIVGKPEVIELLLVGLFAGGHVLLEDIPGVGKTTLAKALAKALALEFRRVQFTPDLLPSDILGSQVLNPQDGSIRFREGPIFTQLLLADEVNRASPRTQSALLEAMNEAQVSVDGKTLSLPAPFFVVATQNPVSFEGTYPLPEAQLDRFLLRLEIGYPDWEAEKQMVLDRRQSDPLSGLEPVIEQKAVLEGQRLVREAVVKEPVADYLLKLVVATREHKDLRLGLSPRGSLALYRACQAAAFVQGRNYVTPGDVQRMAVPVMAHRALLSDQARFAGKRTELIIREFCEQLPVPR